jgi:hypothetical protein
MRSERSVNIRRIVAGIVLGGVAAVLAASGRAAPADDSTAMHPPASLIEAVAFRALPADVQARITAAGGAPALEAAPPTTFGVPATDEAYAPVAHLVSRACFDRIRPAHRALLHGLVEAKAAGETFNVAMCFEPSTDAEFVQRFSEELYGNLGGDPRFQQTSRWSSTATDGGGLGQGDPTTLTYSFVPDGTNVPCISGACWPDAPSDFRLWMNSIYGDEATWQAIFAQVFDRWSELSGISFVYEPNDDGVEMNGASGVLGVRGDLRIGGKTLDGNSGVLAYNNFPQDGDMVFDTFDSFYENTGSNSLRLRNIIAHEHGHGMGLLHVCPANQTKLMEPFISTAYDGPQHDDTLSAQRHYGDEFEHNDTSATATELGTPISGTTTIEDVSIDDNSDVDYYRFTLTGAQDVTAIMTPVGSTYVEGPQTQQCDSGLPFNSLELKDLQVELRDSDGATVLAIGNTEPAGAVETAQHVFGAGGTYFVYVRGGSANTIQAYELDLIIDDPPFVPVAITLPDGPPAELAPGAATSFNVTILAGDDVILPDSTDLHYRYGPGDFTVVPLAPLGGDAYEATLPPATCDDEPEFFVSAEGATSGIITRPPSGSEAPYSAIVGTSAVSFTDDFESDLGWSASGTASDGQWERATPIVNCDRGNPLFDADGSGQCYVTDNSAANGCNSDVDNGTTSLTSPVIDLANGGEITYAYWLNDIASGPLGAEDTMSVEIATDAAGTDWSVARVYTTAQNAWRYDTLIIGPAGTSATTRRATSSRAASTRSA